MFVSYSKIFASIREKSLFLRIRFEAKNHCAHTPSTQAFLSYVYYKSVDIVSRNVKKGATSHLQMKYRPGGYYHLSCFWRRVSSEKILPDYALGFILCAVHGRTQLSHTLFQAKCLFVLLSNVVPGSHVR